MNNKRYNRNYKHKRFNRPNRVNYPKNKPSFFNKANKFIRENPILSAILAMISSIILIRISFSNTLFGNNFSEFRLWFLFFAVVFGIIGIMAINIWIKNNVSNFNSQHNFNWRK